MLEKNNMKLSKSKITIILLLVVAIALLTICFASDNNRFFIDAVSAETKGGAKELNLSKLMPGDWELVCSSHPYDGPLYIKKYNKEFSPVAAAHDGSWGLIFINGDGSYKSAIGSCKNGFNFDIGCIERSKAILTIKRDGSCITYEFSNQ